MTANVALDEGPSEHPEPSLTVVKALYAGALDCGMPGCGAPLFRENATTGVQGILNSRIAHIHARRRGGARWKPGMASADNQAFANLILMCIRHASEIDEAPEDYPADLLQTWKQRQVDDGKAAGRDRQLNDRQAREVASVSFPAEELLAKIADIVPFSPRSRTRLQALAHARSQSKARRAVRLTATPVESLHAAVNWMLQDEHALQVCVPPGEVRVLEAPMGAGKSETAEDWWDHGLTEAWSDPDVDIPVWREARDVQGSLESAVQLALGNDPRRMCRVVLDDLERVGTKRAAQLLVDARRLVLTWPRVSVLATTRPGAVQVTAAERLDVEPWTYDRGIDLLRAVMGEDFQPSALRQPEVQDLLSSPLQVHALAVRLLAGGDTSVSTLELLSDLAGSIIERERPDHAATQTWDNLARLAVAILNTDDPVRARQFAREPDIWSLADTGLVVHRDDELKFALPLFEQHFAAQALRNGDVELRFVADGRRFPRWRYAIAFALETGDLVFREHAMEQLVQANAGAASWVLDELVHSRTGLTMGEDLDLAAQAMAGVVAEAARMSPGQGADLAAGRWLRSPCQTWIDGLGSVGAQLPVQRDGRLLPWAVRANEGHITIAVPRDVDSAPKLAAIHPHELQDDQRRAHFSRIIWQTFPHGDLQRWRWARQQMREPLGQLLQRRTLPVPDSSPLAYERVWFLASRVIHGTARHGLREIDRDQLAVKVAEMMETVNRSVVARWQASGFTIDSDDVRWLDRQLNALPDQVLLNPRPAPDQSAPAARFVWQGYSPELLREAARSILRDALTGYRDLVGENFSTFGPVLGLSSILPVQAQAEVVIPTETGMWAPELRYAFTPAQAADLEPAIDIKLANDGEASGMENWKAPTFQGNPFYGPTVHGGVLDVHLARAATNLAYRWLASDLKQLGWLQAPITFQD